MEPVPRTISENFENLYEWVRRLDRRLSRAGSSSAPELQDGGRLGGQSRFVDDFDLAVETGFYNGNAGSTANVPTADYSQWFVEANQDAGDRVIQTATPHGNQAARYVRRRLPGGVWSDWFPMQRERTTRTLDDSGFQPAGGGAGVTLGNGSATLTEWISDGVVHQSLTLNCGSTTQVDGGINVYCGYGTIADGEILMTGHARFNRSGTQFNMIVLVADNIASVRVVTGNVAYTQQVVAGDITNWTTGVLSAYWSFPIT